MWLVKYSLFFSSAIVSVIGAGAVLTGFLIYLLYNRFLPPVITNLLNFKFLDALPSQLSILGAGVCLSTLIGCCGAIIEGTIGKWMLITYTIELTIFVVLNILIAAVLYSIHHKTSSFEPVASPSVIVPTPEQPDYSEKPVQTVSEIEKPPLRQRKRFYSSIIDSTKGIIHEATNAVEDKIHQGKEFAGKAITKVGDTVGASAISTVGSAVNSVQMLGGSLKVTAELGIAVAELAKDATKLILSLFDELNPEEEEAVKWIRHILGMYTRPVFRLTKSTVVMTAWTGAIGVEIMFIILNIYLITLKSRRYEGIALS